MDFSRFPLDRNAMPISPQKPIIPHIAVSLIEKNNTALYTTIEKIVIKKPDIIEWRVDGLEKASINGVMQILPRLKKRAGPIPLYLTCRRHSEGGCNKKWHSLKRRQLIAAVATSRLVDGIDTELSNDNEYLAATVSICRKNNVKAILSYHNFIATPPQKTLIETFLLAEKYGADMAKVAVMPKNHDDVITLLTASHKAKQEYLTIPFIAISMGELGAISRILSGLFGSSLTFAMGEKSSAPGQLAIDEMRQAMQFLYKNNVEF